jgi:hypothetical protein
MDEKLKSAITEAVRERKQDDIVADELIAWIDAVTSGNESLEDKQSLSRRLGLLFEAVKVEESDTAAKADK